MSDPAVANPVPKRWQELADKISRVPSVIALRAKLVEELRLRQKEAKAKREAGDDNQN